jgi:hypothetical protein
LDEKTPRELPLQGFAYGAAWLRDVAALPPTLSGFTCLSKFLSGQRSDVLVRRSLLVVSTTSRSSAVRPVRAQALERLPQAWPPSQGALPHRRPESPKAPGFPSWGSAPLQRHGQQGPLHPGLPHPARSALGVSHPPGGFLPCHCAVSRTAATRGVSMLVTTFRSGLPPTRVLPRLPSANGSQLATRSRALRCEAEATHHTGPNAAPLAAHRPTFRRPVAPEGASCRLSSRAPRSKPATRDPRLGVRPKPSPGGVRLLVSAARRRNSARHPLRVGRRP